MLLVSSQRADDWARCLLSAHRRSISAGTGNKRGSYSLLLMADFTIRGQVRVDAPINYRGFLTVQWSEWLKAATVRPIDVAVPLYAAAMRDDPIPVAHPMMIDAPFLRNRQTALIWLLNRIFEPGAETEGDVESPDSTAANTGDGVGSRQSPKRSSLDRPGRRHSSRVRGNHTQIDLTAMQTRHHSLGTPALFAPPVEP